MNASIRPMESVLPEKSIWVQDSAAEFNPEENLLFTENGTEVCFSTRLFLHNSSCNYHFCII